MLDAAPFSPSVSSVVPFEDDVGAELLNLVGENRVIRIADRKRAEEVVALCRPVRCS